MPEVNYVVAFDQPTPRLHNHNRSLNVLNIQKNNSAVRVTCNRHNV